MPSVQTLTTIDGANRPLPIRVLGRCLFEGPVGEEMADLNYSDWRGLRAGISVAAANADLKCSPTHDRREFASRRKSDALAALTPPGKAGGNNRKPLMILLALSWACCCGLRERHESAALPRGRQKRQMAVAAALAQAVFEMVRMRSAKPPCWP